MLIFILFPGYYKLFLIFFELEGKNKKNIYFKSRYVYLQPISQLIAIFLAYFKFCIRHKSKKILIFVWEFALFLHIF